jgi:hypothetical protein
MSLTSEGGSSKEPRQSCIKQATGYKQSTETMHGLSASRNLTPGSSTTLPLFQKAVSILMFQVRAMQTDLDVSQW